MKIKKIVSLFLATAFVGSLTLSSAPPFVLADDGEIIGASGVSYTASSTYDSTTHLPADAFDGNLSTYWQAENENFSNAWIQASLSESCAVGYAELAWGGVTPNGGASLWGSTDGSSWTILASGLGSSGFKNSVETVNFSKAYVRYVKLSITSSSDGKYSPELQELRLYESDPNATVLSRTYAMQSTDGTNNVRFLAAVSSQFVDNVSVEYQAVGFELAVYPEGATEPSTRDFISHYVYESISDVDADDLALEGGKMFALTVTDVPENLEFCVRAFAVDLLGNRIYAKDERVKSYTMEKGVLRQTREDRDFSSPASPDNQINEESLPEALYTPILSKTDGSVLLTSEDAKLLLRDNGGTFSLYMISVDAEEDAYFTTTPVTLQVVSSSGTSTLSAGYSSAEVTRYGALAKATLTSANGTVFTVEDRYFYPEEEVPDTFAIRRSIKVSNLSSSDTGYMSSFSLSTSAGTTHDAFMPHRVYGSVTSQTKIQETNLALPFGAIRDTVDGFSLAIARYQPIINSVGNYYASVAVSSSAVTIDYPSSSSGTVTFSPSTQPQIVYDLAISGGRYDSFNAMMTEQYNRHFTLQDQRVVNTDINAVLDAVCDDYKSFMLSTEGSTYTSYGLPWRVTLENGKIGPKSYQSGFVGQQIPAAAEMIWYGINRDDPESLENGLNIVNFWLNAGMMNASGVPKIWYNGDWNLFNSYPTFLRMGVDTMEGLLDAWKAASAANIECSSWYNALISYADWLVRAQNDDGSYYRCYNWSGTVFVDGDDGIPEPSGNICQSYKKDNTAMPVRFLCDMYQLTGNEDYKTAALAAAEYVYTNIYPTGVYIGGTCDNANVVDKEAGVFALYAYDAAYTLTGDSKWIPCMKQAAAFCMSMVQSFSFPIRSDASDLKAAYAFKYGYNDGSSFITRDATGVDNFAAVLYYHLFRLYVITGETCYYDQAEYIQQNTKSAMDWDGALGYPYKSLVPEATSITTFGFGSASDPDGVMGVWLPWQSVANAAPIIDMIDAFGTADVADLRRTDVEDLRDTLNLK